MSLFDDIEDVDDADPMPRNLRRAIALMPLLDPFLGAFSRNMTWKRDTRIWVMATNCVDVFYYNPNTINADADLWSPALLACIIAHEAMHVLRMDHEFTRGRNHQIANVALDAVINRDLLAAGWRFPGMLFNDPLDPSEFYSRIGRQTGKKRYAVAPPDKAPPSAIATRAQNVTAVFVYDQLNRDPSARKQATTADKYNTLKDKTKQPDNAAGQERDKVDEDVARKIREMARKALDEAEAVQRARDFDAQQAAQETGEQEQPEPELDDDESDGGAESFFDDEGDDESGLFSKPAATKGGNKPAANDFALPGSGGKGWSIEQSAAYGALEKLGLFVNAPSLRFMRVLGSKVQGIMRGWPKRHRSLRTPHAMSREYGRLIPGPRNVKEYHVAIAIDISGSISREQVQKFTACAHAWARKFAREADIHVAYFNTHVVKAGPISEFADESTIPAPRGGTSFVDVFDRWIEELATRPTHVLHFSDLQGAWPDEPRGVHVIHIVPPQYEHAEPPFGDVVAMEE